MIDELLTERRLEKRDISCVAASEGPGSFTGVRIGVSTARAVAQALRVETVGVSTLESFVYNLPDYRGAVCPIFDARRGEVYCGAYYVNQADEIKTLIPGRACRAEELFSAIGAVNWGGCAGLEKDLIFFGDGVPVYRAKIEEWQAVSSIGDIRISTAPVEFAAQRAPSVARLALALWRRGLARPFSELKPVYMRMAEAERKLRGAAGA
jgi:tRNA threonylcarbamoyladenosine biosynthesis protein TsaB